MTKPKIHKFDPAIYPYKLWVLVDNSTNLITEKFDEYDGKPIVFNPGDVDHCAAFAMPVMEKENQAIWGYCFFLVKEKYDI
jgi:hypothetical protein